MRAKESRFKPVNELYYLEGIIAEFHGIEVEVE